MAEIKDKHSKRANLAIYLSMKPDEGGKFQYSISMIDALSEFSASEYQIFAFYHDELWKQYIPTNITAIQVRKRNFVERLIRKAFLNIFGIIIWRIVGRFFDPLQKMLYKVNPALVFYPGNDTLGFECSLKAASPIFDLMHRYASQFPEVGDSIVFRLREIHYKHICEYSELIFVDSNVGKQHVLDSYTVEPSKVIILPYIAPKYIYNTIVNPDICKKHNVPEEFIFYPAQLWKHKNHERIIEAIAILKNRGIIINAIFVGSKKNAQDEVFLLINKNKLESQVFFLDYVSNEDLVSFYKKSKMLVMPDYMGPTNIPPLEAIALGCPVLTSNNFAKFEQLKDAAIYCNPDDAEDLASKIESIWGNKDLRNELISKGYAHSASWNQQAYNRKLLSIVEQYIKNKK